MSEYWGRFPVTEYPMDAATFARLVSNTRLPIPVRGIGGTPIGQCVELRLRDGWVEGRMVLDASASDLRGRIGSYSIGDVSHTPPARDDLNTLRKME